uniref:Uncharacterized protein n=1 Tax=Arundo donax TaxID=35708 RepID=A0A0A8Z6Z5_ARUDO
MSVSALNLCQWQLFNCITVYDSYLVCRSLTLEQNSALTITLAIYRV